MPTQNFFERKTKKMEKKSRNRRKPTICICFLVAVGGYDCFVLRYISCYCVTMLSLLYLTYCEWGYSGGSEYSNRIFCFSTLVWQQQYDCATKWYSMEATTVSFCVQYYFCRLFSFFFFFVSSFYIIAFCFAYIFFDLRVVVLLTDSIVSLKTFFSLLCVCVFRYIVRLSISSFGFIF